MNRKSNRILKIQLIDIIDGAEFKKWLRSVDHELVTFKNESGRFIVFFDHPPKDLFRWSQNFNILRGCTYLWHNGVPVTKDNYKTWVSQDPIEGVNGEESMQDNIENGYYEYIPYSEMTNIPPKTGESEFNIN